MKQLSELTGLYSLSKTLRFELKPIGKTLEHIESKGLIAQDEQRAEEYKKVKDIIDRYHKKFITMCLSDFKFEQNSLETYVALAEDTNRDEKAFDEIKKTLRKQIVETFKKGGSYSDLFKKELIQKHLPEFVSDEEEKKMIANFSKFTTYFNGFNENRKNMYSDEDKSTAIAYRLIHENLPMFVNNMKSFSRIADSDVHQHFTEIESSFSEYLGVEHLEEMFQLDFFSETLTQEQIAVYNHIIGGRALEDGTKLKGINEYVNLYNQQHKDSRLPLLKPLYKIILSDRVALPWFPSEEFASDEEMIRAINETYNTLKEVLSIDGDSSLRSLLLNISSYDIKHIYIANDLGLTDISQQMFGQYDVYTSAIKQELREKNAPTAKERRNPELYDERINKLFKSAKSFSIEHLNSLVDSEHTIQNYYKHLGAYDRNGEQRVNLFTQIEMAYVAAKEILSGKHGNISQSDAETAIIKGLLDAFKSLQRFIKPLLGNGEEADKDNEFDAKLREAWNTLDIVTPLYNKVRNWLTRKPYSTEKIKLNFENNGKLLSGWVDSKTEKSDMGTQYGGYIFRKENEIGEYDYYIGISSDTKLFRAGGNLHCGKGIYERLDYYQIKSQTILGSSYIGNYEQDARALLAALKNRVSVLGLDNSITPTAEEKVPTYLKRLKRTNAEAYQAMFNDGKVVKAYENMKYHILETLASLSRVPAAIELSTHKELDIDELRDKIDNLPSKSFGFFPVSSDSIKDANNREEKPLFLFKISNKDLSYSTTYSKGLRKSRGKENLHTMYFKALLGMVQGVYDIGTGEVFFRSQTENLSEKTARHKANGAILNKNKLNKKKTSIFPYELVKDKRFTENKILFHLSIIANYSKPKKYDVNSQVLDIIRNGGIKHIIGIDRGERHLLYISLIDLKGNIVKQMTLNDIVNEYNGNTYATNYKNLLAEREGNRTEARKNWKKIENIKDIKKGYLSQVVHIISKMMVEYNAIVVLEDLNMGFMRGRQKIERSVYEQFEKMLIDKLNYYVDKQKNCDEAGGLLHALQLTSKFESFKKLGKQSGCLFYIPAWNTSKIDPVTGFVNLFDTRYTNADQARKFFSQFDSIRYNAYKDWFEFAFDYNKFTAKAKDTRTKWTLCTYGTRIRTFRNPARLNQWDNEEVVLTDEFKKAFANADVNIHGNLKEAICSLQDKKYLEPLMHLMKLLLQMRNSITNSEVDYLLSPVADENGTFYDSRVCSASLPKDADANGAYNIARKGLWAIHQIQETPAGDRPNLAIKNKDWLNFAQQKPYMNE